MATADEVRGLRERTGMGLMDCKRAYGLASTDEFGGDLVLAVAYVDSWGLAVHVKGDRHAFMMARARTRASELRERHPDWDEAYPLPVAPAP